MLPTAMIHKRLTLKKWCALGIEKQILNIASELSRTKQFVKENDPALAKASIERALELIDLTVECPAGGRSPLWLREFLRLRGILAAWYMNPAQARGKIVLLLQGLLDLNAATHNLNLKI